MTTKTEIANRLRQLANMSPEFIRAQLPELAVRVAHMEACFNEVVASAQDEVREQYQLDINHDGRWPV